MGFCDGEQFLVTARLESCDNWNLCCHYMRGQISWEQTLPLDPLTSVQEEAEKLLTPLKENQVARAQSSC
jgi:hypothetical protein